MSTAAEQQEPPPIKQRRNPTNERWCRRYGRDWNLDVRDELLSKWLGGNAEAIDFVARLGDVSELWDDLIDGDEVMTPARVHSGFTFMLSDLYMHPFYQRYSASLQALMMLCVNAYLDSEKLGARDECDEDRIYAFTLRMYYIDIIIFASMITVGPAQARAYSLEIRDFFYHDDFDPWSREGAGAD